MKITTAAEKSGLSCHTLRYYEKQGLIYPIPRDASGNRYHREHDIHWLHFVQCLKKTGMPLKHIKLYAASCANNGSRDYAFLLDILKTHHIELERQKADIEECLQHINWKIENYSKLI
ncbi:MerR family transcriptional regulator [Vibrio sp. CAU 1672]|uniref:MerR family transcriptional regulator n=1 Tax=Vibrio sp. CAU 1672 TaxID=3032594 RepID=UPI0023DA475A|nr:MerR family transcriptional regulator [Vibrio sp. CAU 1672]MDF2153353.1 MerR family transcriptional regulator [Vibrio sp. CAU 1672]